MTGTLAMNGAVAVVASHFRHCEERRDCHLPDHGVCFAARATTGTLAMTGTLRVTGLSRPVSARRRPVSRLRHPPRIRRLTQFRHRPAAASAAVAPQPKPQQDRAAGQDQRWVEPRHLGRPGSGTPPLPPMTGTARGRTHAGCAGRSPPATGPRHRASTSHRVAPVSATTSASAKRNAPRAAAPDCPCR